MYKMHPISTIEGIGPVFSAALKAEGINYTEDLITTSRLVLKNKFKDNSTLSSRLEKFKILALFIQYSDCAQSSEAFYDANITNSKELAWANPERLIEAIDIAKDNKKFNVQHANKKLSINNLQKIALETINTGLLFGKIVDKDKNPIGGAQIYIGYDSVISEEDGRYFFPRIRFGNQEIAIRATGYKTLRMTIPIGLSIESPTNFRLIKETKEIKPTQVNTLNLGDKLDTQEIQIEDVLVNDHYYVSYIYFDGSLKLSSVKRRKLKGIITSYILKVDNNLISSSNIKIGDVFTWKGAVFEKNIESLLQIRAKESKGWNHAHE